MNPPNDSDRRKGLRGYWTSPPRSGLQLIIAPWEYRRLRGFARVRIASGTVLTCLALVTLGFGGADWKTYGWTIGFLTAGAAQFAWARWELSIARSTAAEA